MWGCLEHSHRVVLLAVAAEVARNGIGVSVGIAEEVVFRELRHHVVGSSTCNCYGEGWSHVECRTEYRAPSGVGIDACVVDAHVGYICAEHELVEERALLAVVEEGVGIVAAKGEAIVVGVTVVTAHDTFLLDVAEREVVVELLVGTADREVVLHDRSVVVEHLVLPVGTVALHRVAVDVDNVVWVGEDRSHTSVHILLILENCIVGSTNHVALAPLRLPAIGEIVVDLSFAFLTLLGGNEDNTVGGTCTIDGTRCCVLQHLDTLNVVGVHKLHTVLVGCQSVNNVERIAVVDGTDTTNANHRLRTGLT